MFDSDTDRYDFDPGIDADTDRAHDDFDDSYGGEARATRGVIRQGLLVLALGALLVNALECVTRTHKRRSEARPAKLPERLQTWEGEGGRPDEEPGTAAAASPLGGVSGLSLAPQSAA